MTQAIKEAKIEARKTAVQAMALVGGEENTGCRSKAVSMSPKFDDPTLKQPAFDWNIEDKY